MSYKISKELFEAVMVGYEYISPHNGGIIYCWKDSDGFHNEKVIYPNDFFFKCKEWAFNNKKIIHSGSIGNKGGFAIININEDCLYEYAINANSEQQAVFDATSWVLEQTKNNK